jgi:hypothetical protein
LDFHPKYGVYYYRRDRVTEMLKFGEKRSSCLDMEWKRTGHVERRLGADSQHGYIGLKGMKISPQSTRVE